MEWLIQDAPQCASVVVEDHLVESVVKAVDAPQGSFPLDPYKDCRLSAARVPQVLGNLQAAIIECEEMHRQDVRRRLRITDWQPWAEKLFQAEVGKDRLLVTLRDLQDLCGLAERIGKDVLVLGD